jgi:hypothetical protein
MERKRERIRISFGTNKTMKQKEGNYYLFCKTTVQINYKINYKIK